MNRLIKTPILRTIAAIALAIGILALPQVAHADAASPESNALAVSPPVVELDGTLGQTLSQKVTLDNISSTPRTVSVSAEPFHASGEEGQAQLTEDGDDANTLASWIKITPNHATIGANGTQDFIATITVPKNASPGGQFAALVFEPQNGGATGGSVSIVSRVTSLFLLKLPGNATEKASISSIDISKADTKPDKNGRYSSGMLQKGPVAFHTRIKNEGNI